MHPIVHLFRLVLSAVTLAPGGEDFDAMFDSLVRAWRRCVECEHPRALMTTATAAVAAQAMVIAVEAHGVGRAWDWRGELSARVARLGERRPEDDLTAAVIALGELRPARSRLDPRRAEAALDVAAAAVALGLAWYSDAPTPALARCAPAIDLALMETL